MAVYATKLRDPGSGIEVGQKASDKVGHYGVTPVNQPDTVEDATDAASAITQLNLVIDLLQETGLMAT